MKKAITVFVIIVLCLQLSARQKHIPVIFDTDLGNDVDDAIALAMLYRYADEGATVFTPSRYGHHRYLSIGRRQARKMSSKIVNLCEMYEREAARLRGKKLVACGDSFTEGCRLYPI